MTALVAPLSDDGIYADDLVPPDDDEGGSNVGRPVFRVVHTRVPVTAGLGILLGGAVGVPVAAAFDLGALGLFGMIVIGMTGGVVLGLRWRYDECADPSCQSVIPFRSDTCPGCGGFVAGWLDSADDRLAAEESLSRKDRRP